MNNFARRAYCFGCQAPKYQCELLQLCLENRRLELKLITMIASVMVKFPLLAVLCLPTNIQQIEIATITITTTLTTTAPLTTVTTHEVPHPRAMVVWAATPSETVTGCARDVSLFKAGKKGGINESKIQLHRRNLKKVFSCWHFESFGVDVF